MLPYERHDLVVNKKTGERAVVLSCSVRDVVVITTRGETKTYQLDETERA